MALLLPQSPSSVRLFQALLASGILHAGIFIYLSYTPVIPPPPSAKTTLTVEAVDPHKLWQLRARETAAGEAAGHPLAAPPPKFTSAAPLEDQVITRAAQKLATADFPWPSQINMAADILPPPGLPLDELNSLERKFYAFRKRVYQYYLTTFFQTYQHTLLIYPNLEQDLAKLEPQELSGRLTYDQQGNLLAMQIQHWSNDEPLENLFEEVLGQLTTIPNIPQEFLDHEQQLVIYYHFYLL